MLKLSLSCSKLFEHSIGAFVPLTKEGNIVVDGVLTSCYASYDHDSSHIAMAPMQWFPEIVEWLFGKDNGSSDYVDITKYVGRMLLPRQHLFKIAGQKVIGSHSLRHCH